MLRSRYDVQDFPLASLSFAHALVMASPGRVDGGGENNATKCEAPGDDDGRIRHSARMAYQALADWVYQENLGFKRARLQRTQPYRPQAVSTCR